MKVMTMGGTGVKEEQEGREMKTRGSNNVREETEDVTTTGRGKIEDNYWHKILLYIRIMALLFIQFTSVPCY